MRLVNTRSEDGDRCGLLDGGDVIDVASALEGLGSVVSDPGVRAFLERPDWRELAEAVLSDGATAGARQPLAGLTLGPVVAEPRKIIAVGANTHSHLKEASIYTGDNPPKRPMLLTKTSNAIAGPTEPIPLPPETEQLDYEVELAAVLGRRARRVTEADALSVVAGFCVANDLSARDYQLSSWEDNTFYRTHFYGKSFDAFCPCGPAIVTPDELKGFDSLRITCSVNGELRQDSTLGDLYFSVSEVISYVSQLLTLEPGDLVLMGSPAGVGAFMDPPGYLRVGDIVVSEIAGIGRLENPIVADPTYG